MDFNNKKVVENFIFIAHFKGLQLLVESAYINIYNTIAIIQKSIII